MAGADQYSVWATDNNGNYTSNLVMHGSGTNASLEAIETSFHQDLNGDGTIGIHAATLAAPVVIASNDAFHFNSSMVADAGPATADSGGFLVRPASELEAVLADQVASFQWANDAHDSINGNPHDPALKVTHIADLHATAVFIH